MPPFGSNLHEVSQDSQFLPIASHLLPDEQVSLILKRATDIIRRVDIVVSRGVVFTPEEVQLEVMSQIYRDMRTSSVLQKKEEYIFEYHGSQDIYTYMETLGHEGILNRVSISLVQEDSESNIRLLRSEDPENNVPKIKISWSELLRENKHNIGQLSIGSAVNDEDKEIYDDGILLLPTSQKASHILKLPTLAEETARLEERVLSRITSGVNVGGLVQFEYLPRLAKDFKEMLASHPMFRYFQVSFSGDSHMSLSILPELLEDPEALFLMRQNNDIHARFYHALHTYHTRGLRGQYTRFVNSPLDSELNVLELFEQMNRFGILPERSEFEDLMFKCSPIRNRTSPLKASRMVNTLRQVMNRFIR